MSTEYAYTNDHAAIPAPPRMSPWGRITARKAFGGHGIMFCETEGHGGFYVPVEMRKLIPIDWRLASFNQQGASGWFEEDCDWCIVAMVFPHLFSHAEVAQAFQLGASYLAGRLKMLNG